MKNTLKKLTVLSVLLVLGALLVLTLLHREPKPAALSRKAREHIEALDDALKQGIISRAEHDRRVAQIETDDAPAPDSNEPDENDDTAPATSAPTPAPANTH
jgi:hypothetical protein